MAQILIVDPLFGIKNRTKAPRENRALQFRRSDRSTYISFDIHVVPFGASSSVGFISIQPDKATHAFSYDIDFRIPLQPSRRHEGIPQRSAIFAFRAFGVN
jgi:hypothetical protein